MVPKICSIPECEGKAVGRGWCNKHWTRWSRHGDPLGRSKAGPEERFWSRVDKSAACWDWTAGKNSRGYGMFHPLRSAQVLVHRYSYELANGPIPSGLQVDHICHNRTCVKPGHLRLVTNKQNIENHNGPMRSSRSGVRGVHWQKSSSRWVAVTKHNNESFYLGLFENLADAEVVVVAKRNELHTHNDRDRIPA